MSDIDYWELSTQQMFQVVAAIQKILYATDDDGTVVAEAQAMVSATEREPNSYH